VPGCAAWTKLWGSRLLNRDLSLETAGETSRIVIQASIVRRSGRSHLGIIARPPFRTFSSGRRRRASQKAARSRAGILTKSLAGNIAEFGLHCRGCGQQFELIVSKGDVGRVPGLPDQGLDQMVPHSR